MKRVSLLCNSYHGEIMKTNSLLPSLLLVSILLYPLLDYELFGNEITTYVKEGRRQHDF